MKAGFNDFFKLKILERRAIIESETERFTEEPIHEYFAQQCSLHLLPFVQLFNSWIALSTGQITIHG